MNNDPSTTSTTLPWIPPSAWLAVTVVYCLALFAGTHAPPTAIGPTSQDKPIHFAAYFGLTLLLIVLVRRAFTCSLGSAYALALSLALTFAAADELTQPLAQRICDIWDFLADAAGSGAAVLADWWRRKLLG